MKNLVKNLKNLGGKTIILSHHNADLDAASSSIVLSNILDADLGVAESVSSLAQKFVEDYNIEKNPDLSGYDNIIIVDSANVEQLKPLEIPEDKNTILIDHHEEGTLSEIAKNKFIDQDYRAVALIVWEVANEMDYDLSEEESKLLAAATITDTRHFRYADEKTFHVMSKLSDKIDMPEIYNTLRTRPDFSQRVSTLKAFSRTKIYRDKENIVAISYVKSHEAAAARALVYHADIAVVIAKRSNEIRISARGQNHLKGKIHLAEDIFSDIGDIIDGSGGGHDMAASANGSKPEAAKEAEDFILEKIEKKIGKLGRN